MSFSAGSRIQSRCTRCKDITSHIVIVVVDNLPMKVECCACGSVHKYHPIEKPKVKKEASPIRVKTNQSREATMVQAAKVNNTQKTTTAPSSSKSTTPSKLPTKQEDLENLWKRCISNSIHTPKAYNVSVEVALNELIDHPTFGIGIVREIVSADKANILFAEGIKMLKCSPL